VVEAWLEVEVEEVVEVVRDVVVVPVGEVEVCVLGVAEGVVLVTDGVVVSDFEVEVSVGVTTTLEVMGTVVVRVDSRVTLVTVVIKVVAVEFEGAVACLFASSIKLRATSAFC
jgi:hypothetical protein